MMLQNFPSSGARVLAGAALVASLACATPPTISDVRADGAAPTGMVLIPACSFQMGDCFGEGYPDETPLHSPYISAFYMDKYMVSYALWSNVYAWAVAHGYTFDNAGSGKATNHPVQSVSWYDCAKWCNARSEMEGLAPCYANKKGTKVYRTGQKKLGSSLVRWTTNGYRLPTEAEWEKAARGGAAGHRFPWSDADTIQHARANYCSSSEFFYDTSPTRGCHPTFSAGEKPYTNPVDYFAPNDYGLHDMAGNVWEWCWDKYKEKYYRGKAASKNDTRGPGGGKTRILRGGSCTLYSFAKFARCSFRNDIEPYEFGSNIGFRCVRGL